MQYSPKLKMAMGEIRDILTKYDIAGIVVIHTPGFAEYLNEISPSYSCATMVGSETKILGKLKHYGGDEKIRDQKVKDTANMFMLLSTVGMQLTMNLAEVSRQCDTVADAEHGPGRHFPHTDKHN